MDSKYWICVVSTTPLANIKTFTTVTIFLKNRTGGIPNLNMYSVDRFMKYHRIELSNLN